MNKQTRRRFAFYGRSLMWSFLLYMVLMIVINWEDVKNTIHGRNATTITHVLPTGEKQIFAPHASTGGLVNSLVAMLQAITGLTK